MHDMHHFTNVIQITPSCIRTQLVSNTLDSSFCLFSLKVITILISIWFILDKFCLFLNCMLMESDGLHFVSKFFHSSLWESSMFLYMDAHNGSWLFFIAMKYSITGFPCGSAGKESACNAGDLGSISGSGRSPGERKDYPLQYSGLEKSMDCIVHG